MNKIKVDGTVVELDSLKVAAEAVRTKQADVKDL